MRKFSFIMMFLFCMVDMLAQKTDAMLFGDVKSKATGEHLGYAVSEEHAIEHCGRCQRPFQTR